MNPDSQRHAQRLHEYRQRLTEAGFKRVSAYISFELIAFLSSKKYKKECLGRTLERLLLGCAKTRPRYHLDKTSSGGGPSIADVKHQRIKPIKLSRIEMRELRQAEWKKLKLEVMASFDSSTRARDRGS